MRLERLVDLFSDGKRLNLQDVYLALECTSREEEKEAHKHVVRMKRAKKLVYSGGYYQAFFEPVTSAQLRKSFTKFLRPLGFPIDKVLEGDLMGAYTGENVTLGFVEYVLHEFAHIVTLGKSLADLPEDLTVWVAATLERFPKYTGDIIEIDTAAVTYWAGKDLGLWTSHEKISASCKKNLRTMHLCFDIDQSFTKAFDVAQKDEINQERGRHLAAFARAL